MNKASTFALLATTAQAGFFDNFKNKFNQGQRNEHTDMDFMGAVTDNHWANIDNARSVMDKAGYVKDNMGSAMDNYWANHRSQADQANSAMDRMGAAMDNHWANADNARSAMDKAGSAMDRMGSAMDNHWANADNARSAMDKAGSAMDNHWAQADHASSSMGKFHHNGDLSYGNGAIANFNGNSGTNQHYGNVKAGAGTVTNFGLINLDNGEFLGLVNLNNVVGNLDMKKGAKVNLDLSKGTTGTQIKSGNIADMKDLTVKQGKGTGLEENALLTGLGSGNVKRNSKTISDPNASAGAKKKAHDDQWALNDKKIAAMDNVKFPAMPKIVLLI